MTGIRQIDKNDQFASSGPGEIHIALRVEQKAICFLNPRHGTHKKDSAFCDLLGSSHSAVTNQLVLITSISG